MIPKKTRHTMRPAKEEQAAVQIVTIPQLTMMREIHLEGVKYFIAMLLGCSASGCQQQAVQTRLSDLDVQIRRGHCVGRND